MKWTIGTKIGGGFALALAALLIIGAVSYRSTTSVIEIMAKRTQATEVLVKISRLLSTLKDAETGQRGFLITGEDRYLEPYNAALVQSDQILKAVRELTRDNPNQQRRLDALEPLVAGKVAELKETIDLRRDPLKGFEAARQVVITDKGKGLMDDIRKLVVEMEGEEKDLMKKRSDEAKLSADQTHSTIVWGTFSAFIFLSLAGFSITRNISGPLNEISGVAEKIAGGDLKVEVAVTDRRDEIGRLSRTFTKMTRSLQEMAGVAKLIAASDLRVQLKPQSEADVLGNAFVTMVDNLAGRRRNCPRASTSWPHRRARFSPRRPKWPRGRRRRARPSRRPPARSRKSSRRRRSPTKRPRAWPRARRRRRRWRRRAANRSMPPSRG